MDPSILLTTLVVRVATVLLAILLLRLIAGALLAGLARVTLDPHRARVLARFAVRVGPRCARGGLVAITGIGLAVTAPGVAHAERHLDVPTFDRAVNAPVAVRATAPKRPSAPRHHVVRAGESLWSIADDALGERSTTRRIAITWPRWYAENREVIGEDPGSIRPGQTLRVPSSAAGR